MKRVPVRALLLYAALAASLGAAIWVRGEEDATQTVAAVERADSQAPAKGPESSAGEAPRLALERLNHRLPSATEVDPFRIKTWYVAPPPPPPPPPPQPTAPPLAFKYMGAFEDPTSGQLVTYLARGDESFTLSPGDTFDDGKYQFVSIEKGRITLLYVPLSIKQTFTVDMQ